MKRLVTRCAGACFAVFALAGSADPVQVQRIEQGQLLFENVAAPDSMRAEALKPYAQVRSAAFAGFLPDGGMAILTRFAETAQIHRVDAPGADRRQLTFFDEPILTAVPNPSPQRPQVAFLKDRGGNELYQLHLLDLASGAVQRLTEEPARVLTPVWSRDGTALAYASTRRNGRDTDVWLWSERGQHRNLTQKAGNWEPVQFSPDGKQLLVAHMVSINRVTLSVLDLNTQAMRKVAVAGGVGGSGRTYPARFTGDGRAIVYASNVGGEFAVLRRVGLRGGPSTRWAGGLEADVDELASSPDYRQLAVVYNDRGSSVLRLLDARSGKVLGEQKVDTGVLQGVAFSLDGRQLGFSVSTTQMPGDAFSIDIASATQTRWTVSETGGLDPNAWQPAQLIEYPSFDRVRGKVRMIPAYRYQPPGPGPHPVVIDIHGGPEAQRRPGFDAWAQYLVREMGVAVIQPNVRGSSGYGRSWLDSDNGKRRMDSVRDIGRLLDWIDTQADLDRNRVAVYGGSYGGFMVLASLVEYGQRLSAGICVVGISHFKTFLKNTSPYRVDLRRVEYGDERDPRMAAFMERIAPLNNARKITKPLFVIHGANDPRVPASEAEQILGAVRANGQDAWFLLARDEGHGFRKKTNRDAAQRAMAAFWDRFLLANGKAPQSAPAGGF